MTRNRIRPVLIVEDEPDFADLLAYGLSVKGFCVIGAADGVDALEIHEKAPASIVVTDVRMPRMDGLELLGRLKQDPAAGPAVVLITANPDVTPEQAHALGAEALFCKPFLLTDLMAAVTRLTRPTIERWEDGANPHPARRVQCRFPGLAPDENGYLFALGRGGAQIPVPAPEPYVGLHVDFNVDLASGPIKHLSGRGVTRWTRRLHVDEPAWACGIEFESLDDEARMPLLDWLRQVSPLSYIPSVSTPPVPGPAAGAPPA